MSTPTDTISAHIARSKELEKGVTEGPWISHQAEVRDGFRKTIADFFTVSFATKCEERASNVEFVATSRTLLPQYVEALSVAVAALENGEGWKRLSSAPRDGTVIEGLYEDGPCLIRWAESRRCMLAGIGGGNGYFGEGWEDDYNHLIVDEPMAWRDQDLSALSKIAAILSPP